MTLFSRHQLRYALYMVGFLVLCLALMELTGNNQSFNGGWYKAVLQTLAPIVILFLGIKNKRDMFGGVMTWKDGFKEGFGIALWFALISPIVFLLYYLLINIDIVSWVRDTYMLSTTTSTARVIGIDLIVQIVSSLVLFGVVISTIASLILKRR